MKPSVRDNVLFLKKIGVTPKAIAEKTGVSLPTIYRYTVEEPSKQFYVIEHAIEVFAQSEAKRVKKIIEDYEASFGE